MKLLIFLFLTCGIAAAENIDLNGGFEKVIPDNNGIAMPAGWGINPRASTKSTARVLRDSGTFRSGNFGFMIECEKDGCIQVRRLESIAVQIGDQIEYSVYVKGKGRFSLGFIVYGCPESMPKSASQFIRTIIGDKQTVKTNQWQLFTITLPITRQEKKKVFYSNYTILPVIYVVHDAELFFDDLTAKIIKKNEK